MNKTFTISEIPEVDRMMMLDHVSTHWNEASINMVKMGQDLELMAKVLPETSGVALKLAEVIQALSQDIFSHGTESVIPMVTELRQALKLPTPSEYQQRLASTPIVLPEVTTVQ
jgi:hypothetical protein